MKGVEKEVLKTVLMDPVIRKPNQSASLDPNGDLKGKRLGEPDKGSGDFLQAFAHYALPNETFRKRAGLKPWPVNAS